MILINVTPHSLNVQSKNGEKYILPPSGIVISAKPVAKKIKKIKGIELFDTRFMPNSQGLKDLAKLKKEFPNGLFIGSMIAANTYTDIYSVISAEGVPRTEYLVYDWKFNLGNLYNNRNWKRRKWWKII